MVGTLPKLKMEGVPYRLPGTGFLVLACGADERAADIGGGWNCGGVGGRVCRICDTYVENAYHRLHIAKHMLTAEQSDPTHTKELCSFCGCHNTGCMVIVVTQSKQGTKCVPQVDPKSCVNGCFEVMKINQSNRSSATNPNSNVPLPCTVPGCDAHEVWKYGWRAHLRNKHPIQATQDTHLNHPSFAISADEVRNVLNHKRAACRI